MYGLHQAYTRTSVSFPGVGKNNTEKGESTKSQRDVAEKTQSGYTTQTFGSPERQEQKVDVTDGSSALLHSSTPADRTGRLGPY